MPVPEPAKFCKKITEDMARMERLGVTQSEMAKFYFCCGPGGRLWDEALVALKSRFKLSPDDAAFVELVLIDNCYEKHQQKYRY